MPWKPQQFNLKPTDRHHLTTLLAKGGAESVRVVQRAQALLGLDLGKSPRQLASSLFLHKRTIENIRNRYLRKGLDSAIRDQWRSVSQKMLSSRQEAEIIAMVCGPHPEGHARWTYELIAQEAKARGICEQVGRTTVRLILVSHGIKPWREKNVVRSADRRRVHQQDGRRFGYLREAALN